MPIQAVVTLQSDTIDEKDDVQNTFTIAGPVGAEITLTEEVAINTAFSAFYNGVAPGAASAVRQWLSPVLDNTANAARLDLYDITGKLDGSPHGSPFSSSLFTLAAPGTGAIPLPSEVAICATLEAFGRADAPVEQPDGSDADVLIDRPQQRFTGRFFVGPLQATASTAVAGVARPTPQLLTDIRMATRKLHQDLSAALFRPNGQGGSWTGLGVWSRKDAAVRLVEFVSTDDAFDTQRRRGESPTGRTRLAVQA